MTKKIKEEVGFSKEDKGFYLTIHRGQTIRYVNNKDGSVTVKIRQYDADLYTTMSKRDFEKNFRRFTESKGTRSKDEDICSTSSSVTPSVSGSPPAIPAPTPTRPYYPTPIPTSSILMKLRKIFKKRRK